MACYDMSDFNVMPDMVKEVIILVCGDRQCGKTTFIKYFTGNDGEGVKRPYAEIYTGKIYIHSILRTVKIFEISGGPKNLKDQMDCIQSKTKAIIFMYAIDDRSSFECLPEKWIQILEKFGPKDDWPCILVGNKKDLRENPDSVKSLAEKNQRHVTSSEGDFLRGARHLDGFYETSAMDSDGGIPGAFEIIVEKAILHWRGDLNE